MKNIHICAHEFQFWKGECTILLHVLAHSSPELINNCKPRVLSKGGIYRFPELSVLLQTETPDERQHFGSN